MRLQAANATPERGQARFSGDAGLVVSRQDARSIAGLPMATFVETEEVRVTCVAIWISQTVC